MKTVDNDAILVRRKFYYPDCDLKQSEFTEEVVERIDAGIFRLSPIGVSSTPLFKKEQREIWHKLMGKE